MGLHSPPREPELEKGKARVRDGHLGEVNVFRGSPIFLREDKGQDLRRSWRGPGGASLRKCCFRSDGL